MEAQICQECSQPASPERSWQKFLFSNTYLPGWEKVGTIHKTEESFTSTNIVTWCQVSYHVVLFRGKWWKIRRRDYEVCIRFDGALWKIPIKLCFPGSTEQLALYTLLVHWHRSMLYCRQLCYRHVYMKHTRARFGKHGTEDKPTDWQSVKQSQSDYISLDFIKSKATMGQH